MWSYYVKYPKSYVAVGVRVRNIPELFKERTTCCGKSIGLGHKNLVQASTLPFIGVIIKVLLVSPSLIFFFCKMEVIVPTLCFIDLMR